MKMLSVEELCQRIHIRPERFVAGLLGLAVLAAYGNALSVPFLFDDNYALIGNPSIVHFWPLPGPLLPPAASPVGGRPVLNVSYALNCNIGGYAPSVFHLVNLVIHFLAGLTLFGIARRTLERPVLRGRFAGHSLFLAADIALLWLVHPLQTESVTYISQRAESLMGLFYLLTLYCLIRLVESPGHTVRWTACGIAACYLGMGTKEVMITAPAIALFYDRTFLAGSFREALRLRWVFYLGLTSSWLFLAWLLTDIHVRSVGLGLGVSPWDYALTQCKGIIHYLWLFIHPYPLVFDYGAQLVSRLSEVWPQALLIVILLAATAILFVRRPAFGFVGTWFFVILSPTSSFIPLVFDPITEHRLYLPLAALIALLVLAIHVVLDRKAILAIGPLALALIILTACRNEDYQSPLTLWTQTVAARPDNPRAYINLGETLIGAGHPAEALPPLRQAIALAPHNSEANTNLGAALCALNRLDEGISYFEAAVKSDPKNIQALNNWANAKLKQKRSDDAYALFEKALVIGPHAARIRVNYANALLSAGKLPQAIEQYQLALRDNPDFPEAIYNLGYIYYQQQQFEKAEEQYRDYVHYAPDNPAGWNNLGAVLLELNRKGEAIEQFRQALLVDPHNILARDNLIRLGVSVQ